MDWITTPVSASLAREVEAILQLAGLPTGDRGWRAATRREFALVDLTAVSSLVLAVAVVEVEEGGSAAAVRAVVTPSGAPGSQARRLLAGVSDALRAEGVALVVAEDGSHCDSDWAARDRRRVGSTPEGDGAC